jgi:hypothetical protein
VHVVHALARGAGVLAQPRAALHGLRQARGLSGDRRRWEGARHAVSLFHVQPGGGAMSATTIIAEDFDRARRDLLAEFQRMIAADRRAAMTEALVTIEALLQLLSLETADAT